MYTESGLAVCFATTICGSPQVVFVDRVAAMDDLEQYPITDAEFFAWINDNLALIVAEAQRVATGVPASSDEVLIEGVATLH